MESDSLKLLKEVKSLGWVVTMAWAILAAVGALAILKLIEIRIELELMNTTLTALGAV